MEKFANKDARFTPGGFFLSGDKTLQIVAICLRHKNLFVCWQTQQERRGQSHRPLRVPLDQIIGALFGGECVAVAADEVVRGKDVRLLLCKHLPNRQRKVLVKRVSVGLLGGVFTLLGSLKQRMISAA
ncbi:MAG: hypothetical protein JWQ49_2790 [Edaphobacter sp.]|nr:hypothetical protein [Edaphobacter sp.]